MNFCNYLKLIQYDDNYYLVIAVSDKDNSKEGNLLDDYENSGDEYRPLQEEDVADIWGDYK